MNKIDGVRISAARGYLTGAVRSRPNFRLVPRTIVRRVLFTNRQVCGVEVEHEGAVATIVTNKVVVSAGAIATPGILLRSGVGPRAKVERLGVDVTAEVPAVAARPATHRPGQERVARV